MQAGVFGFVDYAHTPTAEFFNDAVVRNRLSKESVGSGHVRLILLSLCKQVNERAGLAANFRLTQIVDQVEFPADFVDKLHLQQRRSTLHASSVIEVSGFSVQNRA